MTTTLTLTDQQRPDGTPVLVAEGEIDMSNVGEFRAAVDRAAGAGAGRLVVDLTAVDYLDSAGLAALFAHADRLELIAPPLLGPVLTVSGLADLATVHMA
ncbi:STAS domain-containing protein [Streptomyces verrucosisporus]|uniref:STAS domain-containing protein n=1 Tax=Streptomyces verrucosisporus TaxID=1695161 RepID=UPI0019D1A607|nr:STAS domain-containing protein [Streptomyces verrucosisporus]MBN3932392.1 STAS domain-containing protein [Streptomyces verrucosisporus]